MVGGLDELLGEGTDASAEARDVNGCKKLFGVSSATGHEQRWRWTSLRAAFHDLDERSERCVEVMTRTTWGISMRVAKVMIRMTGLSL